MSGMSGMNGMGMDMGSDGMFRPHNQMLARTYWYLTAAFFLFACLLSGINTFETWSRLVFCRLTMTEISGPLIIIGGHANFSLLK